MPARNRITPLRVTAAWILAGYLAVLLVIMFWPTPVDRPIVGVLTHNLAVLHSLGAPGWMDYASVGVAANVALYVPIGVFGTLLLGVRFWWLIAVLAAAASSVFELSQGIFLTERFASVGDVIANTSGALIGAVTAVGWRAIDVSCKRARNSGCRLT